MISDTNTTATSTTPLLQVDRAIKKDKEETILPQVVGFKGNTVILESKDVFVSTKLIFQVLTCYICLIVAGLMDQTIGTIMQYMTAYYDVERSQISCLFIYQFSGYLTASFINEKLHHKMGLQYLMIMGLSCQMIDMLLFVMKAPLPVLYAFGIMEGFGSGTIDCGLNLFVGGLKYSNQLMGIMHACYGLGCFLNPLFSIGLIEKGMSWNYWYLVMFGVGATGIALLASLFRNENRWKYRYLLIVDDEEHQNEEEVSTKEVLTNKYVLFLSFIIFIYVGSELCIGVWMFNYLLTVKKVTEKYASYSTSSYWAAMTIGRCVLGFVTGHWFDGREVRSLVIYTAFISVGCFNFWIVSENTNTQVVMLDIVGFFAGPVFATSLVAAIKILPKRISNAGIPIICGIGSSGVAVIPWAIGLFADNFGEGEGGGLVYFPDMVFFGFLFSFLLWVLFYFIYRIKLDNYQTLE